MISPTKKGDPAASSATRATAPTVPGEAIARASSAVSSALSGSTTTSVSRTTAGASGMARSRASSGTRARSCVRYDNTSANPLNPSNPPKRVLFGNGSTDEMCFGIFQVLADRRSDEQKIGMALMQSAFKQWNESSIDAEGRKHILDEAGKLFGTDGGTLNSLLNAGRRGPPPPKPAEK